MSERPIGVFDSGIGGLTVLNELIDLMPNENYIYLADLYNNPYGEKSPDQLKVLVEDIISFFQNKSAKLIVVACNTASTTDLKSLEEKYKIPIVNVIDSGIGAIDKTYKKILVASTKATAESGVYPEKIASLYPDTEIISQACPAIVPAIEGANKDLEKNQYIVDQYISQYRDSGVDFLILACTHYPIWTDYFRNSIGQGPVIYNPAKSLAQDSKKHLDSKALTNVDRSYIKGFVTDKLDGFKENSSNIIKGYTFDSLEKINLKKD